MGRIWRSPTFHAIAIAAILAIASLLVVALFNPGPGNKIRRPPQLALDSDEFLRMLEALTDAPPARHTQVEVLSNGENFYQAELDAIRAAKQSVNLEAYIFSKGRISQQFIDAMAERARAGVQVRAVIDGVGSFNTTRRYFKPLLAGGGQAHFYHPIRWNTVWAFNNRTHREMLIVDGRTGFLGGAGIADHWLFSEKEERWRDTMFRVTGDAVTSLQSAFVENWLEASGEILVGKEYFPFDAVQGTSPSLVVASSPASGGSRVARSR